MIKKILIGVALIVVGYIAAVFLPLPADIESMVKSPFTDPSELVGDDVSETVTNDEPEEEPVYYYAQDLLVGSAETGESFALFLGTFLDQDSADKELSEMALPVPYTTLPYETPVGSKVVLALLGQFADKDEAVKQKVALEGQFDLNLQVVKFPTPKEPPADTEAPSEDS